MIKTYLASNVAQNEVQTIYTLISKLALLKLPKIKFIKKVADFLESRMFGVVECVKNKLGYKTTKIKFINSQSKK